MKTFVKLVSSFVLGKLSFGDRVLQGFFQKSFANTENKWDFDYALKIRDIKDFERSKKAYKTLYLICLPDIKLNSKDEQDMENLKIDDCNALISSLFDSYLPSEPDVYKPSFFQLKNIKNKMKSLNEMLTYNHPYPSSPEIRLLTPYHTKKDAVYYNIFRTYSETKLQQYGRAEALFRKEAACMEKSKIIIGPPATIAYIFTRMMQYPAESWCRFQFPHCSLTTLKVYDSGFVRACGVGETFKLKRDDVDIGDCVTFQEFKERPRKI